ncbi:MAG: hypothetical protein MR004_08580 [Clostridiales bacterium]|nr:hypothetical protein [bacterium 210917-SL.2.15]MCI5843683.1 hypothetical protein [Clostridiales bacterium]MDY4037446.1 hypothetical protein [Candidatus Pseudoscilispira sp.]
MVKGVSRQVIVVSSPDRRYFDEAIFILRSDAPRPNPGVSGVAVEEACRIARRCAVRSALRRPLRIPPPLWAAAGAALVALIWVLCSHGSSLLF